jgi:hypothetical protein
VALSKVQGAPRRREENGRVDSPACSDCASEEVGGWVANILHLERLLHLFYGKRQYVNRFHENARGKNVKMDNLVDFPTRGLDLSWYTSGLYVYYDTVLSPC